MASPEATAPALSRTEVRFRSGEAECAGVLIRPDTAEATPCVVLAHGFGAVKEGGPVRTAERLAAEGFAGLAFDYRYFGESGGEPRQNLNVKRQLEDWRAAIDYARALDGVDAERIGLWGSSYSGGHVMAIAADDPLVKAAVSQSPYTHGPKTLMALGPAGSARLALAGLRDLAGAALGREPYRIPIAGPPGSLGAMITPDAEPGYGAMYDPGFEWRNEFMGRAALTLSLYSPGQRAGDVQCPLLVQVCSADAITPPGPAIDAAASAPKGELITYAGLGHFDIYRGEPFERAVADQLDFFKRHLT
ncbi:MAG TPA: alpha/beta hydrolase [Solirubrobacterales bacterium]|nr:alpha/beta hydrolase [Solirubrobacterales bacterium]